MDHIQRGKGQDRSVHHYNLRIQRLSLSEIVTEQMNELVVWQLLSTVSFSQPRITGEESHNEELSTLDWPVGRSFEDFLD